MKTIKSKFILYIAFSLCALVLLGYKSCSESSAKTNSVLHDVGMPVSAPDNPDDRKFDFWAGTWIRCANIEHVDPFLIKAVADLLKQSLSEFQSDLPSSSSQVFEQSLYNYIKGTINRGPTLRKPTKGDAYWLVYCMLEADRRHRANYIRKKIDYDALVDKIGDEFVVGSLRRVLSHEDYGKFESQINDGSSAFKSLMKRYIRNYQDDFLCPAFKGGLDARLLSNIKELSSLNDWFKNDIHIPQYTEPSAMMASKDKVFLHNLKSYFLNRSVNQSLYCIADCEVQPRVIRNEYWGYMKWSMENDFVTYDKNLLFWPVIVRMIPNITKNKINNWKKDPAL